MIIFIKEWPILPTTIGPTFYNCVVIFFYQKWKFCFWPFFPMYLGWNPLVFEIWQEQSLFKVKSKIFYFSHYTIPTERHSIGNTLENIIGYSALKNRIGYSAHNCSPKISVKCIADYTTRRILIAELFCMQNYSACRIILHTE